MSLLCDRLLRGDEVRWVRVHASPLAREGGGQDWCGITWDMTEQHLAEEALRAERDHAEKLSHAKGAFLVCLFTFYHIFSGSYCTVHPLTLE